MSRNQISIHSSNAPRRILTLAISVAAVITLVTACGDSSSSSDPMAGHSMPSTSAPASPAQSGSSAATPAADAHNDDDVTFATMMIPHHQQAIEMSDLVLAKEGIDPQVADLAGRIKAAQTPEITQMSGWLAGWGENPSPSAMGGMDHDMGDGMMSQADMDALKNARADQAAEMFLTGMIKHHQGAVVMAQTELDSGQNSDAKKLAQAIISTQQAEITEMKKLLGQ